MTIIFEKSFLIDNGQLTMTLNNVFEKAENYAQNK